MEAGAAPCHLTLTLWETAMKINKEEEKHSERERERENGGAVNNNDPPPEPELLLSLFVPPTFWFQTKAEEGVAGRGERACIPLALACASISPPPYIKAVFSWVLWESEWACPPAEWMVSRSCEEPGRWHWLSSPSVCLSGSGEEISLALSLLCYTVTNCGTSHTWIDRKCYTPIWKVKFECVHLTFVGHSQTWNIDMTVCTGEIVIRVK